jgi:hypothetical protein
VRFARGIAAKSIPETSRMLIKIVAVLLINPVLSSCFPSGSGKSSPNPYTNKKDRMQEWLTLSNNTSLFLSGSHSSYLCYTSQSMIIL